MIKWCLCEKNIEKFEGPLDYQINIPGCQSHNINLYDAVLNCLGGWHTLKTFFTKSTHTYFIDNCSGTDHVYKRLASLPVELIRRSSGCLSWNPLGGHINSTTAEKQIKNYSLIASFLYHGWKHLTLQTARRYLKTPWNWPQHPPKKNTQKVIPNLFDLISDFLGFHKVWDNLCNIFMSCWWCLAVCCLWVSLTAFFRVSRDHKGPVSSNGNWNFLL